MLISCIVFAQNEELNIEKTFHNLVKGIQSSDYSEYEIILVDDHSEDLTYLKMQKLEKLFPSTIAIRSENEIGIVNSILAGFNRSSGRLIVPIPGHNMFGPEAISSVLGNSGVDHVVIGFRSNLYTTRPLLKYISSKLLLAGYHSFVYNCVKDIHGLNSYPRNLIELSNGYTLGHGFHMIPVTLAIKQNFKIMQISIDIISGHKQRKGKKVSANWPSLKSVNSVSRQLLLCRHIKFK